MRITNVQQTNYNPQFNGYIRLTDFNKGITRHAQTTVETDQVLLGMFKNMTTKIPFENWSFDINKNLFIEYCKKAAELTGISDFKKLPNDLPSFFKAKCSRPTDPSCNRYFIATPNIHIFHSD